MMKACREMHGLLNMYIDNELHTTQKIKIERHLAECNSCHTEYVVLINISDMLKETEEVSLPDNFSSLLHEKLDLESKPIIESQKSNKWNKILKFSYGAAAIFMIAIFAKMGFNYYDQNNITYFGNESTSSQSMNSDSITMENSSKSAIESQKSEVESNNELKNPEIAVENSDNKRRLGGADSNGTQKNEPQNPIINKYNNDTINKSKVNNNVITNNKVGDVNGNEPKKNINNSATSNTPNNIRPIEGPQLETPTLKKGGEGSNVNSTMSIQSNDNTIMNSQTDGEIPPQNSDINNRKMVSASASGTDTTKSFTMADRANAPINIYVTSKNKEEALNKITSILTKLKTKYNTSKITNSSNQLNYKINCNISYNIYTTILSKIKSLGYNTQVDNADINQDASIELNISIN